MEDEKEQMLWPRPRSQADLPRRAAVQKPAAPVVRPDPALRWRLHPASAVLVGVFIVLFAAVGLWRWGTTPAAANGPSDRGNETAEQAERFGQSGDGSSDPESAEATGTSKGYGHAEEGEDGQDAGSSGSPVLVYVTGAVREPGVVQVAEGARLLDAVDAAGGLLPKADLASQNLARVAVDGEHIHVTVPGETPPPTTGSSAAGGSASGGPASGGGASGEAAACVDLNTADVTALQVLDGIGPKLAERIVDHRESVGGYQDIEQLLAVPGIGPVLFERVSAGVCS